MTAPNFDPAVETTKTQVQPGDAGQGQQVLDEPKINPAWQGLLDKIPDKNWQKMIIPELQQWDQNYNNGIQKVHSQYAPYKPFLDAKVEAEQLNNALLVYQAMENDPEKFIQAVAEFYELQLEQGQDPEEQDPEFDDGDIPDFTQHPEFQRYGQMTEKMAEYMLMQQQQIVNEQQDQALEQELAAAKGKFGEFDEDFVIQNMLFHEMSAEDAVKKYQEFTTGIVQNYRSPGSKAPTLAGGGGGVPSQQTPVSQLSGQDRRKLMVDFLTKANAQGG